MAASKFTGALIRRERLRQNFSQDGLCQGICTVSYLSKIEQGKAEAGSDILQPLLSRLGITYETDTDFLAWAGKTIESLYENLYAGRGGTQEAHAGEDPFLDRRDRLLASPYMMDVLLLERAFLPEGPLPELKEFTACMDRRQYEIYLLLQMRAGREGAAEELLRLNPCGFFACHAGILRYQDGRYLEAAELLGQAYDLSAREGHIYLMILAKLFLGNCCSDGGQLELMLEHFKVVRRLAQVLPDAEQWLSDINYNTASTYLEWDRPAEALALLQSAGRQGALYFHKLAVALEKLGRLEEALEAVARGRTAQAAEVAAEAVAEMLDLVEYRLRHPDYLRDGTYAALMETAFARFRRELPQGFIRFHLPYMLEVLEAERRYKEAYRLLEEFSCILKRK